jgi:hypothetical protein
MTIESAIENEILHIVISLCILLFAAKIFAEIFARLRLPIVLGELFGSAGIYPQNATFIAQQETANELQRAMNIATNKSAVPPIPTVTFPKNMTLQIGKSDFAVRLSWK